MLFLNSIESSFYKKFDNFCDPYSIKTPDCLSGQQLRYVKFRFFLSKIIELIENQPRVMVKSQLHTFHTSIKLPDRLKSSYHQGVRTKLFIYLTLSFFHMS